MPQGSYYNNTNVRRESDMDLRAVHPIVHVEYDSNVYQPSAEAALAPGYHCDGRTFDQVVDQMRAEIYFQLVNTFGVLNLDMSGSKAVRVKGLVGSRADADIFPCFTCHYIVWNGAVGIYQKIDGIGILDKDGRPTIDFPEYSHRNGIAKRTRTLLRFKKNIRMLKHIRDEFVEDGTFKKSEVPSFLVESLVYRVEDDHFLVDLDRYGRLRRIVERMCAQLNVPDWSNSAREINDIKLLFGPHQRWSLKTAQSFAEAALVHLIT